MVMNGINNLNKKYMKEEETKIEEGVETPAFGEKTCELCGTKMSGPGIDENTVCATPENHQEAEVIEE